MDNKDLLVENSLYKTPAEMNDLLKNKEGVANAFFINLFGTLGLLKISSKRGTMKTHLQDDGQMRLSNIADTNKDISLSVKLAVSAGILKFSVAQEITRLLFALKSKQIKGEEIADAPLRDILSKIQYKSHRPHVSLLPIIEGFADGTLNIQQVAKQLFLTIKTRKKELMPFATEFYDLAKQYSVYFAKVDDTPLTTKAQVAKATQATAPQIQPQAPVQTASGVVVQPVTIAQSPKPVPTVNTAVTSQTKGGVVPTTSLSQTPPQPAPAKETLDQFVARVWNQNLAGAGLLNQGYYDKVKKQLDDLHSGGHQKALMEIVNGKRSEFMTKNFGDLLDFSEDGFGAVIKELSPDAWFAYSLFWFQANITGIESVNSDNVELMGEMRKSGVNNPELIRPFASVVQNIIGFWITYMANAKDKAEYKRGVSKMKTTMKLAADAVKAIMIFEPAAWANVLKKNNINEDAAFKAFAGPLFAGVGEFKTGDNGVADWKGLLTNYKIDIPQKKVNVDSFEPWLYEVLSELADEGKTGWKLFVKAKQSTAGQAAQYTIQQLADDLITTGYLAFMTQNEILDIKNKLLKFAPDISFSLHSLIDFVFPNNGFAKLTVSEYQAFFNDGFGAFLEAEYRHEAFALMALWMEANVKKLTDFNEVVNLDLQRLIGNGGFISHGKKTYRDIKPLQVAEKVCETVLKSWIDRINPMAEDAYVISLTLNAKQFNKVTSPVLVDRIIYPAAAFDYMEKNGYTDENFALTIIGMIVANFPRSSPAERYWRVDSSYVTAIIQKLASKEIILDPSTQSVGGINSPRAVELLKGAMKASDRPLEIVEGVKGEYTKPFKEGFGSLISTISFNKAYHASAIAEQLINMPDFVSVFESYMGKLLNLFAVNSNTYGSTAVTTLKKVHKILLDAAVEKKGTDLNLTINYRDPQYWYTVIDMGDMSFFDPDTQKRLAFMIVKQNPKAVIGLIPYTNLKDIGFNDDWIFEQVSSAIIDHSVNTSKLGSFLQLIAPRATPELISELKSDGYTLRRLMAFNTPFQILVDGLGINTLIDVASSFYNAVIQKGFTAASTEQQKQWVLEVLNDQNKGGQVGKVSDWYKGSTVDSILDNNLMRLVGGMDRHSLPWMYGFVREHFEKELPEVYPNFPSPLFAIKFAPDDVLETNTKDRILRDVNKIHLSNGKGAGFKSYKNNIIEKTTEIIKRVTKPEVIAELTDAFRGVFSDIGRVKDINEVAHLAYLLKAIDEKNHAAATEIYSQMTVTAKGKLVNSIAGPILYKSIHDRLMEQEIRPENNAKPEDVPSMLARNNIDLNKRAATKHKTFRDALNSSIDSSILPEINAVRVDNKDQDVLDRASARLNGLFRSNRKHGPEGLKVLGIYDTTITNGPEWDAFAAERAKDGDPNTRFETVWHGTGTVGGSFILRYGFKITPFDRATMAGRALGNGIYFAKFTDKSLQYLRDDSNRITRVVGQVGYLFEMEAQIGRPARRNSEPCGPDEGKTCDHRSGGFAEATNHQDFASPEWAVFKEKGQLRIKKVYKVEIVDLPEWKANCVKYGINPV